MNKKVYEAVMGGKSDHNIRYGDFQNLIVNLGFDFVRQNGSHTHYKNKDINKRMNTQADGTKAKAYQVKQLRDIITMYGL